MNRLALVFLLTACSTTPVYHDKGPIAPLPNTERVCADACEHLHDMGCVEGPVQTGLACNGDWECNPGEDCVNRWCVTSCESFCVLGSMTNPVCTSRAPTCEDAELCHKR